ncbi:hypothetical protein Pmani_033618 [Petrolisthes manimaculis]|uniref:Uncharacterized protein n=1 Tax=Petrolisthes manimaculis TaxID=1843537 RepID=A0AAE1NP48_9EUCA|nr:hypothetical protein Pmani_033618 [Petrolisthes manimaculis]
MRTRPRPTTHHVTPHLLLVQTTTETHGVTPLRCLILMLRIILDFHICYYLVFTLHSDPLRVLPLQRSSEINFPRS